MFHCTLAQVNYLYDCIDCDGDNDLDAVEIALGLKSIEGGLAKAKGESPKPEVEVCQLALSWFHSIRSGSSSSSATTATSAVTDMAAVKGKVTRAEFVAFCMNPRGPVLPFLELYAAAEGAAHADAAVAATTATVDALLAAAESKAGAGVAGSAGPGEEFMVSFSNFNNFHAQLVSLMTAFLLVGSCSACELVVGVIDEQLIAMLE
jgi:hypothetical protein